MPNAESWPQARPCLGVSSRTGRKRTSDSDRPPTPPMKQTIGVHLSHCWRPSHGCCRPRVLWPSAFPARAGPSTTVLHKHTQCIIYPATSLPGTQAGSDHIQAARASGTSPLMVLPTAAVPPFLVTEASCVRLLYVLLKPTHISLPCSSLSDGKGLAELPWERCTRRPRTGGAVTPARGQGRPPRSCTRALGEGPRAVSPPMIKWLHIAACLPLISMIDAGQAHSRAAGGQPWTPGPDAANWPRGNSTDRGGRAPLPGGRVLTMSPAKLLQPECGRSGVAAEPIMWHPPPRRPPWPSRRSRSHTVAVGSSPGPEASGRRWGG